MSNHPKSSAKNETGEFSKFTNLLDRLLSVPYDKIKSELDAEKERKKRASKHRASSGHASGEKG